MIACQRSYRHPSAGSRQRIQENVAAGQLILTPEQVKRIDALDKGMRLVNGPWFSKWNEV